MKLYLNLTTDENRKVWPALMMSMYDDVEHIIAHHYQSQPDKGPLIRQAAREALMPIMNGMVKLQDTLLEFHFDGSDNNDGIIDTTIDLFTADNNAAKVREEWVKEMRERGPVHFEDSAGDQHVLNLKEEEIETFIEMADQHVKEISAELWASVAEQIKTITLRFTPPEHLRPSEKTQLLSLADTSGEGGNVVSTKGPWAGRSANDMKSGLHLNASEQEMTLDDADGKTIRDLKETLNKGD